MWFLLGNFNLKPIFFQSFISVHIYVPNMHVPYIYLLYFNPWHACISEVWYVLFQYMSSISCQRSTLHVFRLEVRSLSHMKIQIVHTDLYKDSTFPRENGFTLQV